MSKRRGIPPPDGPWLLALTVLRSPLTLTVLGLCLAAAALLGLSEPFGAHPAEGALVRIPLALLPFVILARMNQKRVQQIASITLAAGTFLFLLGTWPSGGRSGRLEIGTAPVEGYEQTIAGRTVPTHLGGQLYGRTADNLLLLEMRTAGTVQFSAEVPLSSRREVPLGPYRVRSEGTGVSRAFDTAVVTLRPRLGKGPPVTVRAPLGQAVSVGQDGRLTMKAVRGDYLGVMGSAAHLEIVWSDGQETAWHFVDGPELDVRTGTSPWKVSVDRLETSSIHKLGIRKAGLDPAAWVGLIGIGLALIIMLIGRERTT